MEYDEFVNRFDRFMTAFFIMFECNDFYYNFSMPADECFEYPKIGKDRLALFNTYLNEAKNAVTNIKKLTNVENIKKPFSIDQLMEDDFTYLDDDLDYNIGEF